MILWFVGATPCGRPLPVACRRDQCHRGMVPCSKSCRDMLEPRSRRFFDHCNFNIAVQRHIEFFFVYSSIRLFVYSSIRLFVYSSIRLFVYSSIRLFVYSSIRLFVYSSIRLFVYSSIRLARRSHASIRCIWAGQCAGGYPVSG